MKWQIIIENLSTAGFAPAYWKSSYPSFGNKNMLGAMTNIDLTNPAYLTQGVGLATITGTVDTLMKGILNNVFAADKSAGIGGTKVYEITPTTVTSKTIGTITGGEDIALYAGKLYYSWATNIGRVNTDWTSPDEDWWTTVAGGSALTSGKPHQMIVAGTTGILSILNGSVVATWDGSTATNVAFNTKDTDITLVSQVWNLNRFWFAGNKPNVSGRNRASIFIWDGSSPSWENEIRVDGKIGALFVKNGITFVFYQKNLSQGVCTLGYANGSSITDVANYYGSLPEYYQVTDYEDFIIWASGTSLFAFGGGDLKVDTRLFQLGSCGAGGLANPFGTPITASTTKLEKFSGYTTTSSFKTLLFDAALDGRKSMIDKVRFDFEKLATGARVDYVLRDNKGTSLNTGTISYTTDGAVTSKIFYPKCLCENFRIEGDFTNGSATNNVAIKSIKVYGHTI
jgi:hypothetical protein